MSVDKDTVKRVAHLARIAVSDAEAEALRGDLNTILGFVEQLNEVDVTGVEPMTAVVAMKMKMRDDVVTDGDQAGERASPTPRHARSTSSSCRRWWNERRRAHWPPRPIAPARPRRLDRDRDAAAGRCARHGRRAQRLSDAADAARVPVPADGRADGGADGDRVRRPRRRRPPAWHGARSRSTRRRSARSSACTRCREVRGSASVRGCSERIETLARERGVKPWCWRPARHRASSRPGASTSAAASPRAAPCSTIPIPATRGSTKSSSPA